MNRVIIITRPFYDAATKFLFHWCRLVIDEAKEKHFKILDLKEDKANKTVLESYIKKHNPALVFLNGHGGPNLITGQNHKVLIESGVNDHILSKKIIYARSCNIASFLGPTSIKRGARAFIGYTRKFYFAWANISTSRPLTDSMATLFLNPSNMVMVALIKGQSAQEAYDKSQKIMRENHLHMISSNASFEENQYAPFLWSNLKSQILLGDKSARIV